MNLDQIAGELRQMPDTALQQQAKVPGAVPGYLVADEIQRRIQARKAPPQQGNDQGKPTILSILANNLAPPQTPINKPMAQVPFSPVPSNNLMTQPTMPQHLDDGGTVKSFDPSTLYSDVPVGPGSGSAGDVQTNDLATAAPPSAMPPTPVWNPPTSAATPDEAQPPVSSYPQTSTSPIQDPPNTHKGGRSFLETLTALAPAMQYLGNIGAGAGRAGGNFATGVGYANEQQQAQMQLDQARKDKQAELAQEMALKQGQMGMESQKMQMEGLMGGAKFVGPDGKVQEAPVNAPSANINGVPMGGGQIAGSGSVPSNPQMTQMTGLQGYGGRQMDYSDILTPQKQQQLAVQNREAEQANQAGLEVAKAKALWINLPKELAGSGFSEGQLVPPSVVEARMKEINPALETHWDTNNQGDSTLLVRNPVTGDIKQQVFKGVGPNKDQLTAVQQAEADHRDAMLAASLSRITQGNQNRVDAATTKAQTLEHSAIDKQFQPLVAQSANLDTAQDLLGQGSVGAAVGQIKGLVGIAGGQGSGVRITKGELESLGKGAGIEAGVDNWLNSLTGAGLSEPQKQQWNKLISGIQAKVADKQQGLYDYRRKIDAAESPKEINQLHDNFMQSQIHTSGGSNLPSITTQAQYDALPSKAHYLNNGVEHIKP
jgi:hypothetical protein